MKAIRHLSILILLIPLLLIATHAYTITWGTGWDIASYDTMVVTSDGQYTGNLDPLRTFQMPYAATLVEVSVCARDIDTSSGNETYTIDVEEAGTTVLSSAISIVADNTAVVGTVSDSTIADNAKIEIVLTAGGTSPTLDDLTVLLVFKVLHTTLS